jgi:hypothetical protein
MAGIGSVSFSLVVEMVIFDVLMKILEEDVWEVDPDHHHQLREAHQQRVRIHLRHLAHLCHLLV